MGRNIDLNSAEWTDMVFEGQNKAYGAYYLRNTSAKRHVAALGLTLLIAVVVVAIPSLMEAVKSNKDILGGYEVPVVISDISMDSKVSEENIIREAMAPPPPILKTTTGFTPPAIVDDDLVNEKDMMKSQDQLLESKAQISIADVIGVDDPDAVDIADLEMHKVIVEEKEEAPRDFVEQMPQYPGGTTALMQFIAKHVKYPTISAEGGVQGKTIIGFVVGKDGKVRDVKVLRGFDAHCDKEAVRVIQLLEDWIPGKQNGRAVPVRYTLPVTFKLQ